MELSRLKDAMKWPAVQAALGGMPKDFDDFCRMAGMGKSSRFFDSKALEGSVDGRPLSMLEVQPGWMVFQLDGVHERPKYLTTGLDGLFRKLMDFLEKELAA